MEQFGSNWTDFNEFFYFMGFIKSVEKTQCLLKSDSNNGFYVHFFPPENNVEKYGRAGQTPDDNTARALCMLAN